MPLGDAVSVCSELDAKLVEIVIEFEKYQDIMNEMGECLRQVLIMGDIMIIYKDFILGLYGTGSDKICKGQGCCFPVENTLSNGCQNWNASYYKV